MNLEGRLKVLFLSQPFLFPMDTGGKIRTGKLLQKLKAFFDVTLVSNFDASKDASHLHRVEELCHAYHPVPRRETNKHSTTFYLKLFARLFSRYPITVIGDYSKELETQILGLVRRFHYDLLICDFLQPSLNFEKVTGHPTILFQHNVESVIPKRHFQVATNPLMKALWKSQWRKLERYEREACQRFSGVIAVSEADKKTFQEQFGAKSVFAIPTGVDTEYFSPRENQVKRNSLIFTGSMDWLPNEDAIIFFAKEILSRIKEHIPDISLSVVGRHPSHRLLKEIGRHPEIQIVGRVSDIRPYISRHAVYIVPLRIGAGTRIKIYEAMAMGKAVISTRIGVEGLPVCHGHHLFLADEPEEFAAAVTKLLEDTEQRKRIERNARSFVEKHFSWGKVAAVFADICREVVAGVREERNFPQGKLSKGRPLPGRSIGAEQLRGIRL